MDGFSLLISEGTINPTALRMIKILWNFGCSQCIRANILCTANPTTGCNFRGQETDLAED